MIGFVLELYAGVCVFSIIAFLVWACFAKLRPDLDEGEPDLDRLVSLEELDPIERWRSDIDSRLRKKSRRARSWRRPFDLVWGLIHAKKLPWLT
jgi:hypothetical protein